MKNLMMLLVFFISSAVADAQVVPILDLKARGLLGGVIDGKFVPAETAFKALEKNQKYGIFSLGGGRSTDDLSITINAPRDRGPCNDFYSISRETEIEPGVAVGANANWNVLPQAMSKISLTDKTYLNIVSNILKSKGLPRSKARLEQALRVDLEGDGVDEVVLTASSFRGNMKPAAKTGDYSFVVVRKIIAGKVKNILLGGTYIKKSVEFGAPSRFELSGVADLDGDGQMEIVIYTEYYEGSGAWVTQIKDGKEVEVKELRTSCGV